MRSATPFNAGDKENLDPMEEAVPLPDSRPLLRGLSTSASNKRQNTGGAIDVEEEPKVAPLPILEPIALRFQDDKEN